MSKIQPLGDRVIGEPYEAAEKTSSGLYLPSDAKEKQQMAKVIAVGKDVKEVKLGNTILYKEFSAENPKVNGKDYIIIKEEDVLAIVK